MKKEVADFLHKPGQCLAEGRTVLSVGASNAAGRDAYLTAFHAAQAYVFALSGKISKTHQGVHALFTQLAKDDEHIPPDLRRFVSQAYDLKAVADYEMGADSVIPIGRTIAAIETAQRFLDCITARLEKLSSDG